MTAYSVPLVYITTGATSATYIRRVLLRAGSYAIKISRVELNGAGFLTSTGALTTSSTSLNHYVGSTISGGTLLTPQPMREGAAAASATVRYQTANTSGATFTAGTAVSVTGTALTLDYEDLASGNEQVYQPPSDLLIAPGSVFEIAPFDRTIGSGTSFTVFLNLIVYFEEYHLARST